MEPNRRSNQPQESQSEEKYKTKESQLGIFYCPKCKNIPSIEITKDTFVVIQCRCFTKEDTLVNGEIKNIMDLCKYKSYIISLERFLDEAKKIRANLVCFNDKTEIEAKFNFCADCQKWLCQKCMKNHKKTFRQHDIIMSEGLMISPFCESTLENGLRCQEKVKVYCKTCDQNLCLNCMEKHGFLHKKVDLENLISEEMFQNYSKSLQLLSLEMKKDNEEILEEIKKKNLSDYMLKDKIKEDDNLILFFISLISTYNCTKGVNNFNILNNIIKNDIKKIYAFRKRDIINQINYEVSQEKVRSRLSITSREARNSRDTRTSSSSTEQFRAVSVSYIKVEFIVKEKDKKDPIKILGDKCDYLNDENCFMTIEGKNVPFTKEYRYKKKGKFSVEIQFKEDLQLEKIHYLFSGCSYLYSVDFSHFDTSNVDSFRCLFNNCSSLTKVNFTGVDTSNVFYMNYMFAGCSSLESVDLSSFDTKNVNYMGSMFYCCTSLKKVNLSNFDTSNVNDMGGMFCNCISLKEVDISGFKSFKFTLMNSMFYKCPLLAKLKIKSETFFKNSALNRNIFFGCKSLPEKIRNLGL